MSTRLWLALTAVAIAAAALVSCSAHGSSATVTAARPDTSGVASDSVATVKSLIDHGALVLDVRTDAEWTAGTLAGSVHIPLAQVQERHGELPRNRTIVAVCHDGGLSYKAAFALRQLGYNAVNLAGGLKAWAAAGLPLVDANGAAGRVI